MNPVEFDAWFTGENAGAYRATNAAEISERNELSAFRDLEELVRERSRLHIVKDVERDMPRGGATSKPWDSTDERIAAADRKIAEIAAYLQSAGWPLDEQGEIS